MLLQIKNVDQYSPLVYSFHLPGLFYVGIARDACDACDACVYGGMVRVVWV